MAELEYYGINISTSEWVYGPGEDSLLAAKLLMRYLDSTGMRGIRVLDMGTGTGLLGLVAARSGKVREVVFSDINSRAIELAKRNYSANRKIVRAKCHFVLSDLFSNLNGKFDIMVFNAPYLRSESGKKGEAWWDGGNEGIEVSLEFMRGSVALLNGRGSVFLVYSSLGNSKKLLDAIEELGFAAEESESTHLFFEDINAVRFEMRRPPGL
ncbi:MAG: methyltransferase [Candidatus Micrarchaeaceae archaeon]